jgi:hypothetical protein
MPELNKLREVDLAPLRALQGETPATRIAFVRQVWPDISAALNAGHSLTVVHQRLTAGGFDIPYRTLVSCVNRIRLEQARTVAGVSRPAKVTPPRAGIRAAHGAPTPDSAGSSSGAVPPRSSRHPLANVLEHERRKLPGFHFTGEPPDPNKLF